MTSFLKMVTDWIRYPKSKFRIFEVEKWHSALKLEKSAISEVQENIISSFKNGKNQICTRKKLKTTEILFFFQSENCIFGSFELFSGAKIDFLPFLQIHTNNAFLHF